MNATNKSLKPTVKKSTLAAHPLPLPLSWSLLLPLSPALAKSSAFAGTIRPLTLPLPLLEALPLLGQSNNGMGKTRHLALQIKTLCNEDIRISQLCSRQSSGKIIHNGLRVWLTGRIQSFAIQSSS
ncbi:hypothetical protein RchiOBHm_Chr5g0051991 [Rosa chinensis]|uniref:Uncharacterized protein n=1 Tax=Rosa chinensis TaxID=74649 RepID=A0A2P6QFI3_ROSCH|nr:hypothetical protein RchiOBHm_Chr5g0051991 [Rosa chinensis]